MSLVTVSIALSRSVTVTTFARHFVLKVSLLILPTTLSGIDLQFGPKEFFIVLHVHVQL